MSGEPIRQRFSAGPYEALADRAKPTYSRIYNAAGVSIARVYYPDKDAAMFSAARELVGMVAAFAGGDEVSRAAARDLAVKAGWRF